MLPPTAPVPQAKDTGAKYKEHVISSGPYKFETLRGRQGLHAGPQRPVGPGDRPEPQGAAGPVSRSSSTSTPTTSTTGSSPVTSHVDIAGTGVQPAALGRVLGDPDAQGAAPTTRSAARLWYTSINPKVAPLDNIECRKAVMYAADKTGYQTAYGGEFAGGEIATSLHAAAYPGLPEDSTCTRPARTTRATSTRPRRR